MSNLNKSARGAQGKSVFLTKSNNSANNSKKKGSTLVIVTSNENRETQEEENNIQDAVIIQEETTTQLTIEATTAQDAPKPISAAAEEPAAIQPQETAAPHAAPLQNLSLQAQPPLSVDDIIEKADKLQKLNARRLEIKEKLKECEDFELSHDDQNAIAVLKDINGREIRSQNPVSIGKIIEDWIKQLTEGLQDKEKQIRELAQS